MHWEYTDNIFIVDKFKMYISFAVGGVFLFYVNYEYPKMSELLWINKQINDTILWNLYVENIYDENIKLHTIRMCITLWLNVTISICVLSVSCFFRSSSSLSLPFRISICIMHMLMHSLTTPYSPNEKPKPHMNMMYALYVL